MKRRRTLRSDEIETLKDALVQYRKLAIQCSNTAFNLAQALRDGENGYQTTFQLVRDYDRAENRLIEVLKDAGLFKSLSKPQKANDALSPQQYIQSN